MSESHAAGRELHARYQKLGRQLGTEPVRLTLKRDPALAALWCIRMRIAWQLAARITAAAGGAS